MLTDLPVRTCANFHYTICVGILETRKRADDLADVHDIAKNHPDETCL